MTNMVSQIIQDIKLPQMINVKQIFPRPCLEISEISEVINKQLKNEVFSGKINPGMRIAITAGSRGIANFNLIIKTVVDFVKSQGGEPFIIPAMGSHGGATAEGQEAVLRHYGITECNIGCPVISSMEVAYIGLTANGHKVFLDKVASEADGIIVIGRIKAHTDFTGPFESGIMKMMTIGMGNHTGASNCHEIGFKNFHQIIPEIGKTIINKLPVLFAIAILENPYDETFIVEAIEPQNIEHREPILLEKAKKMMPKLYFEDYDILIVDKIGKDISGNGMDPHITGAYCTPYVSGAVRPQKIAVLDLTTETNGNAIGVGDADATTKRLWQKTVLEDVYPNAVIAHMLSSCKIPIIMENDKEAIQVCIKTCENIDKGNVRLIRIKDTLHMEHIMISEALLNDAASNPNIIIESGPFELVFNNSGNLW